MKQLKLNYHEIPLERKQAVAIAWQEWCNEHADTRGTMREFDEVTGTMLGLSSRSVRLARQYMKIALPARCPLCRSVISRDAKIANENAEL